MLEGTMIRIHLGRLLGERKMKMSELSRLSGISKNALSELYYEKTQAVRFDTLNKLCQLLNCRIDELLEYIPDEPNSHQEAETGQSHLILGTSSASCIITSRLTKPCCIHALYKALENLDAIALEAER